jgi:protein-L-isoaspartate(D-aspartate) O-methyltransferase
MGLRQAMSEAGENDARFAMLRKTMVDQVALYADHVGDKTGRGSIADTVMAALARVPRHAFVPVEMKLYAYVDSPLPIGCGKTISQPFIVALMTDLLEVGPADRVLEIGTGLGYQAALLAELAADVFTIEIIEELAEAGQRRLGEQGYANIHFRLGDGNLGWPDHAPFDRIIATAAPDLIPPFLLQQLKPGGRMVIPAGLEEDQCLLLVTKDEDGRFETKEILPVRFSSLASADDGVGAS